jgi:hypothetical protein
LLLLVLGKATLLHPAFYLLVGVIAVGLIGTGLTARGSLTALMARMPWNRRAADPLASAG